MALDVPTVSAQLLLIAHPEPTFAAAPSPIAGNQGILLSMGQREAYSDVNPCTLSRKSPSLGNCSGFTPSTCIISLSHVRSRVISIPVPEAIERLQTD